MSSEKKKKNREYFLLCQAKPNISSLLLKIHLSTWTVFLDTESSQTKHFREAASAH